MIGAGGSARAVVYSLSREGVEVLIINGTVSRARERAAEFGCRYAGLDEGLKLIPQYADIIVQTTSLGMEPQAEADPIPGYTFQGHEVVYDIVYKPPVTRFLQRARDAGCITIEGMQMLLHQAYAQFLKFTGQEYPLDD